MLLASQHNHGAIGSALLVGGFVAMALAWHLDRKRRAFTDRPTTPAAAVFSGRNEVAGVIAAPTPVVSHHTQTPSVWWEYEEEEERNHTRTVTDTDADGNTRTRQETYQQWHTIQRLKNQLAAFDVVDDTGSVQVQLQGATIVAKQLERQVVKHDRTGGFLANIGNNKTGRYRHTEQALPVGAPVFVVGDARLRTDTITPEIYKGSNRLLVSTRSEASHTTGLSFFTPLLVFAAGGALTFGLAFALTKTAPIAPLALLPGFLIWLALVLTGWTVVTYNRLRLVNGSTERAWSLIEVQLARRRDLLPGLARIAEATAEHEGETQARVAAQRSFEHLDVAQAEAAAIEQTVAIRSVVGRIEAHPELAASRAYANLMEQIADTENRISGARTFYNDSVTITRDRSEAIPGSLIARFMTLPEPGLFAEAGLDLDAHQPDTH